jgi:6-phosphogluconolactonase (cycloisomerase 2 family)
LAAFAPGVLSFVEVQRDGVDGVDGLGGAYSAAVSPDGKHVYAAGSTDNAVAVFSRDATTGSLSFVEAQKNGVAGVNGLTGASGVAVSPDGKHVYATGGGDSALAVFARNASTGALSFVEYQQDGISGVDGLLGANSVAVSPDGKHVYATGQSDNALAVFSRNPTTGALTFVEAQKDGVGGVYGLSFPLDVTVSPDGKSVCVAGEGESAVAVFGRDAATGSLGFVEAEVDGVAGVDGLSGAYSVAFSPDGRYVYAAGYGDSAIAIFRRDAATGSLTFLEAVKDGVAGVHGIGAAHSVLVSPDGRTVYARGGLATLAVFHRDPATGSLVFFQLEQNGVAGVEGLAGDYVVTVSPDGRHLYAPSFTDNAIAVFAPEPERGLAAASALAVLGALTRGRQRGLSTTTGMSRVVPAWCLS